MKDNKVCTYCGKEYPYRKNKIYCSASCKTMAHRDKLNGSAINVELPGAKYSPERKVFYTSDYDNWVHKKIYSFTVFCFLIKGIPENEEPEISRDIASAICNDDNFSFSLEQAGHPVFKEYRNFLELFFADKYKIKKDRPSKEETK